MLDDYSDYPKSVGEMKAERAGDAGLWTPRDALISALRAIDSGEIAPTSLIVVCATLSDNNETKMDYFRSQPNTFYAIGMLTVAIKDQLL